MNQELYKSNDVRILEQQIIELRNQISLIDIEIRSIDLNNPH